jgi:hypothetical protein
MMAIQIIHTNTLTSRQTKKLKLTVVETENGIGRTTCVLYLFYASVSNLALANMSNICIIVAHTCTIGGADS